MSYRDDMMTDLVSS